MSNIFKLKHTTWSIKKLFKTIEFGETASIELVNCNRHYLSQVVSGAALGLIFAFAAHKTRNDTTQTWYSFQLVADNKGAAIRGEWRF